LYNKEKINIFMDNIEENLSARGGSVNIGEKSLVTSIGFFLLELIKIVVMAGITIALVRYFLFKPFYVKGASMEPNFYEKDYLIIDELSYRFREPERGEIIVFEAPVSEKTHYLKRIIGLPGERVKIEDSKVVIFNKAHPQGFMLDETFYLTEETPGIISRTIGPNEYFVLGDNRNASLDSRKFGPIQQETIVGRVFVRGLPIDRIGVLTEAQYEIIE
jgi:signal peptidase I